MVRGHPGPAAGMRARAVVVLHYLRDSALLRVNEEAEVPADLIHLVGVGEADEGGPIWSVY